MKLTEQDLEYIIKETHRRYLEESVEEGKLGRALGAAALGSALMFGAPSCAKMDNPSEPPTEQVTPQRQQEIGTCLMTYDIDLEALIRKMGGFDESYQFNPTYQCVTVEEFGGDDFDDCFVDITRDDIPSLPDEEKDFYLGELLDFYYKHQQ